MPLSGEVDMMSQTMTVVIPAYNEETAIGPCLDAILAQSRIPDEIIVVDNNSTDATLSVLAGYGAAVTVLHEARQGVQHARNRGFGAATGDIIIRIDADSRLPGTYLQQVEATFADPAIAAATGPVRYYDVIMPGLVARMDALIRGIWALRRSRRLDWVFGANMAIRRPAWHAVAGLLCSGEQTHEDVDLGIHLHHGGFSVCYDPRMVAATSARRIRADYASFRHYLKMTERGYADHSSAASLRRARITNRCILAAYPILRTLHESHRRRQGSPLAAARKNPMAGV
ncbi:glycosyl transferase [Actinoplanes sp. NBRC 101535]|nr:glycosyl transferase [Actinoplanes sp. NBRC 101535]